MKIFLKQNWSEQFIYGDKTPGIFVGRKQEIKSLKSVIKNNDSSAILVSSIRGVGKTSFVHKALSEIKKSFPVFVNIGHTLSNEDIEKEKKQILVSLIRATYFNEKLKKELNEDSKEKLKDLYEKSTGTYYIEQKKGKKQESTTKSSFKINLDIKPKDIVSFVSTIAGFILIINGIAINNPIFSGIGIFCFLFSVFIYKEKIWHSFSQNEEGRKIDDTTGYLEIEFENWLKNQSKKIKKIVFVIDELDKIDEEKALKVIKEYKNLFTRSFTHFIFISSEKTFDLVTGDREKDAEKGGIFPTLFTHIFYLSLPKADEIKSYLNEIFDKYGKPNEKEKNELINYLLLSSGNDFFELKRLIADVIVFDDKERAFIDTKKIKEADIHFSKLSKLFEYVNEWFLKKYLQELKKHWKNNSILQKEVFKFLNKTYNKNFSYSIDIKANAILNNLLGFLVDIGIVEKKPATSDSNITEGDIEYIWTNRYKRDLKAPLTEDDKAFQKSFSNLIRLANDLDDLPEVYKTNDFSSYQSVSKDSDGQNISGINLYSTYMDYKIIYNKLKNASQRISVTTEKVKEANNVINEQIKNITTKYFEILINLLTSHILKDRPGLFLNQQINQIPQIFASCPNFQQEFASTKHSIYGKKDNTKSVMILENFSSFVSIHEGLESLINQKNILIINITEGKKYQKEPVKIQISYKDKRGRNRKKKVKLKNFINFTFSDFQQFAEILLMVENHLIQ